MKRFSLSWFFLCTALLAVGLTSAFALGAPSPDEGSAATDPPPVQLTAAEDELPVIGSARKMKELLREMERSQQLAAKSMARSAQETAAATEKAPAAEQSGADYSTTNVQVAGVDEADIVKTDGTYLYLAGERQITLAKAYPAEEMKVVSTIPFAEHEFQPLELYVDGDHLVAIGRAFHQDAKRPWEQSAVKAIVYDIRNKEKPVSVREIELEGQYVSSRKIGSALYMVTNRYLDYDHILENGEEPAAPVYRDTATAERSIPIEWKDIRYFPESKEPNYLFVAGIDLAQPKQPLNVSAYLGSGDTVYASTENLYVVVGRYETAQPKSAIDPKRKWIAPFPDVEVEENSTVYKFALKQGKTVYAGSGKVPGRILNQFSLDEHDGYLRIATTTGNIWRNDEYTSKNNLYVLDDKLAIAGKLEGLAPGEKIYSARFIGDRAYMVTFKKVDPLFVIDLKEPRNPAVLGALKIPGYSDYLHPYDENHIIGFGKDTVVAERKDGTATDIASVAYYQGMKMAMFDVSDISRPVEKWKEIIGDRGTESELLRNHKALLFSKEKNLLAFPVTVMEIPDKEKQTGDPTQYGRFTFQGALVYRIDPTAGFTLQGKITHLTEQDVQKAGDSWYESRNNVERILYIGDTLYTVSKGLVKATDLANFKEKGSLVLP